MGFFKRLTSSWRTPNKRNNHYPMGLAIENRITDARTGFDFRFGKQAKARRKVNRDFKKFLKTPEGAKYRKRRRGR